ncbi:MAG TPA: signal peptidase I [Pyrinomonadaceae bacterium]|jgi:signal peptidase I
MSKEPRGAGVAEPAPEVEGGRATAGDGGGAAAGRDGRVTAAKAGPRAGQAPRPHSVVREYFESLVVTAVMALFGMTFIVQAVKVPTGSMQNTIQIGDHLLVNKFIFAPGPVLPFLPQREIRRGDIIVFKYPGTYQGEERFRKHTEENDLRPDNIPYKMNYVKRVIGLPGDVVEVRESKVFINGQPLEEHVVTVENPPDDERDTPENEAGALLKILGDPEPAAERIYDVYTDPERRRFTASGDGKFIVPEGHYFAMGDNRDNSLDSRFWGYVPRHAIVGRAMFVYWSFDESAPRSRAPFPANVISDFVSNTRWARTGTFVK